MRRGHTRVPPAIALFVAASLLVACGSTVQTRQPGEAGGIAPGAAPDLATADDGSGLGLPAAPGVGAPAPLGAADDAAATGSDTAARQGPVAAGGAGPRTPRPGGRDPSSGGSAPGPRNTEPIRVGYVGQGGNPAKMFGIENPLPTEDRIRRWYKALADHVNERGGSKGRPLQPVVAFVDQTDQSEGAQTRLQTEACVQMTEDEKVLFVSSDMTAFAQGCYKAHQTAFFNAVASADTTEAKEFQPWMIPSYFMLLDRIAKLMPLSLEQQGKVREKIGIIAFDRPEYRRAIEKVLIPELKRRGAEVHRAVYTRVKYDEIAAQMANAVVDFRGAGVERVIAFANGGGLWLVFSQNAESQQYRPAYGISTMDRPFFTTDFMPDAQKHDIIGPGFMMQFDIDAVAQPEPTQAMHSCWKIINEGGGDDVRPGTTDAVIALAVCEQVFLTDHVLEHSPDADIARADIPALFRASGESYDSLLVNGVNFSAPRLDATRDFANMTYDRKCACVRYVSPWQRIPF